MKRVLLFSLLCVFGALSLQAAPWAETEVSVSVREKRSPSNNSGRVYRQMTDQEERALKEYEQEVVFAKPEKITVLPLILKGQPIKVSIYPPSVDEDADYHRRLRQVIQDAYDDWFENAISYIQWERREYEFMDVLPILKQKVLIEFVPFADASDGAPWPEDVWVSFRENEASVRYNCQCESCIGCYTPGSKRFSIAVQVSQDGHYSTLVHELGHTLGLADAYASGYQRSASRTHRSQERTTWSIMDAGTDNYLTADDADGLINLIDSWQIKRMQKKYPNNWREHISPRVLNGWDSLAKWNSGLSVDRYVMGTSAKAMLDNAREDMRRVGTRH